jgi:hypothetical protein
MGKINVKYIENVQIVEVRKNESNNRSNIQG